MNEIKTEKPALNQRSVSLMKLIGKAIAERPAEVRRLLGKYNIVVRNGNEANSLTDAVLYAIGRNNKNFQSDLSDLLSEGEEDHFLGQIAGAVGQVANVIGGAQQNKAMKEQARSQTLSSILAYKAQQDQNKTEQLKIQRNQKPKLQSKSQTRTLLIITGVAVVMVVLGLIFYQSRQMQHRVQPVTRTTH